MNSEDARVLITGIGTVTPFGNTLNEFFEGLKNKRKVQGNISLFRKYKVKNPIGIEICLPQSCEIPEERILYLGECAISSAIDDWGGNITKIKRVGLILGSGLGLADHLQEDLNPLDNLEYLSSLGEKLTERLGIICEVINISSACSAGSQAISYGRDLLLAGCLDLVIAGGVDMLSQMAYAGFLRLNAIDLDGCKPFDKNRKGITVGEGAAFFIIERVQDALARRSKIYCSLVGAGVTNDAYHVVQPNQDGVEIKRAMDQALKTTGRDKSEIDLIVAHGTGTYLNDKTESNIIYDYFGKYLSNMYVTAPKGAIGHTGGASGAFGVLAAIGSIMYNIVPPVLNLEEIDPACRIPIVYGKYIECAVNTVMINSFAFGGTNVVLVCMRLDKE